MAASDNGSPPPAWFSVDRANRSEALSNRVLELTPDGIHQYGGGYTEYVERTGQEAPGLRS